MVTRCCWRWTPFVINPHLYTKLSYDPIADFAPITSLVHFDLVLAAHPSLPNQQRFLCGYAIPST